MAKSFNDKLIELLKTDPRFVDDEGELVKAAVIDRAWKIDRELVKLLLSQPEIKAKFFDEIEGHWIFNINTFIEYISDKNFLANSYTRFRNKIGLTIDGKFLRERGEVALVWPYKDCVLEGGQTKEEEKRKEIFFNEILAQDEIDRLFDPKVLTNWKRYTVDGEQKVTEIKRDENGMIRENLIIKGNNLLALHTLKTQFRGKVKLIYIDPPYNTGNDEFGYNDSFNHSTWLTFMKNRLEVAKELLSKDGIIFVQCDYIEFGYLRILMDEIFGRNKSLPYINVKTATPAGFKVVNPGLVNVTEHILIYAMGDKTKALKEAYVKASYQTDYNKVIVNKEDQPENWKFISIKEAAINKLGFNSEKDFKKAYPKQIRSLILKEAISSYAIENADKVFATYGPHKPSPRLQEGIKLSEENPDRIIVVEKEDGGKHYLLKGRLLAFYKSKLKLIDGELCPTQRLTDLWTDISWDSISNEGGVTLKNGKKPEKLIKRIIEIATTKGDIVLDYHLGSGTTAAVAHKMGRQYIGIEQLDYGENDSIVRLKNVINGDQTGISKSVNWKGGGNFIYCELMKYNEAFMDKIQEAKTSEELVELWKDIAENSFLNWYVNPEMPEEAVNDFIEIGKGENGLEKQKKLLVELLNKNQLYVNLSEIDDEDFGVSEEDKMLNQLFYGDAYNG